MTGDRNSVPLKFSGGPIRMFSVVRHVGRKSGAGYRNPVAAYPLDDGFVIAVVFGRQSNWVRNVLAADTFELRTKGHDYTLARPTFVAPQRALPALPVLYRMVLRRKGIEDFLYARTVTP